MQFRAGRDALQKPLAFSPTSAFGPLERETVTESGFKLGDHSTDTPWILVSFSLACFRMAFAPTVATDHTFEPLVGGEQPYPAWYSLTG